MGMHRADLPIPVVQSNTACRLVPYLRPTRY